MKYRMLLIVNPVSGKGKIKSSIKLIIKNLKKDKFKVCLRYTSVKCSAQDIIENHKKNYDVVFVIGGDGTLNQVVSGLTKLGKKVKVGFIPLGTTNDFAKSLKVKSNRKLVYENIFDKKIKECDTGKINDKYFNYIVAFGIFTKASYSTSRKSKKILGRLAYILNGAKEIFDIKKYKTKIYVDNQVITDDFIYGGISNSSSVGGFELYDPKEVDMEDGKFEAMFIKMPKNIFRKIKLGFDLLFKKRDNPDIICFKASKIRVEVEEPVNWTMDGEYAGKCSVANIENIQKNMSFIV